jgi:adenylate cyclase
MGINLGDVIEEGERIYGDGVNIAARMEGLAQGGGICISGTTFDHVENKLGLEFEYLGERAVKNINKPIRVYQVKMAGIVSDVERSREVLLPDKPSIAVLPFENMSGDPDQEYFSDGITEEIITGLSKIPKMFVIARNSTFAYKGKPIKVQQVSKELGVKYVLQGSIRKGGNRIRITAQLVDAVIGNHLWAERYDRDLKEMFALQDEITMKILTALQVELTEGEQALVRSRSTNNLEAWGYAVKAASFFPRGTKEDNAKARELLKEAIEIDPNYAFAWTALAWTHWFDAKVGWTESQSDSFARAYDIAQKALDLDASSPDVHILLGGIHVQLRRHEEAIAETEKAIALGPSHAEVHAVAAHVFRFVGRFEAAIAMIKKALRLQPNYPSWYLGELAMCYYYVGRHEEAIEIAAQFRNLVQNRGENEILWWYYIIRAMNYVRLGREKEARAEAAELLRVLPEFSLDWDGKYSCYKDPSHLERQHKDLRKAGLK